MDLSRKEVLALLAMAFAVFMDGLDASIVNIALPSIAESFGTDTNAVAWVTITYFMMIAGLMLSFGRLAESGHIRKVYIIGFVLFSGASLMCGLSQNLITLVAARVIQGIGAAMIGAVAPMICVKFISGSKLGLALSILMFSGAIGFGAGPAIGGFIVDLASWHWAFFINVPIGILAILFAFRALPKDRVESKSKLDMKGTVAIFLTMICGVYVLEMFSQDGQGEVCLIMGVISIVSMIAFIIIEKRVECPMLNLRMFKEWKFDSATTSYLLLNLAYMGIAYIIPFYLTKELELSYTFSGLIILIPSIVTIILSIPAGRYSDKHGRRGMAIVAVLFMLAASIGYYLITPDMGWWPFIPIGIMGGIFWGLCGNLASRIVDLSIEEEKGMASTLTSFLYYMGGSIGTALFASLLTFGSGSIGIPIEEISAEAFMDGYTFAVMFAIPICVVALILTWIVNENKVRTS